jgi:cell wall-associated NlpC family hydrolase
LAAVPAGPARGTGHTTGAALHARLRRPALWAAATSVLIPAALVGTSSAATGRSAAPQRPPSTVSTASSTANGSIAGTVTVPIRFVKNDHPSVPENAPAAPAATRESAPESTPKSTRVTPESRTAPASGSRTAAATRGHQRRSAPSAVAPSGSRADVLAFALSQVGKPYRFGGTGNGGWDCSGLVSAAYRRAGVSLPHSANAIGGQGRAVPAGQWQPGDVIHSPGHVALYLGNGLMVEAANPRAGVRVTKVRPGTARRF